MKKAFTLVELIFVIVIISILIGLGYSSLQVNYSQKDAEYLLLKIKQTRYRAMGVERENTNGCIKLDIDNLQDKENNSDEASPYTYRSTISNMTILKNNTICFDSIGRPYNGDAYDGDNIEINLIRKEDITITLTYNTNNCTIRLYKFSGYGIIQCE